MSFQAPLQMHAAQLLARLTPRASLRRELRHERERLSLSAAVAAMRKELARFDSEVNS